MPLLRTVLLGLALFAGIATPGCQPESKAPTTGNGAAKPSVDLDALRPEVEAFCGDCHAPPSPEGFPKVAWRDEVRQGFEFYTLSERSDLAVPPLERVVEWFRTQAPDEIRVPVAPGEIDLKTLPFKAAPVESPKQRTAGRTAVSFLKWGALNQSQPPRILMCDMRSGAVSAGTFIGRELRLTTVGQVPHPAHAVPTDLDGDGVVDLVVADLGSFQPADHDKGQVVWLRQTSVGNYTPSVLQSGLGRVADVEPGDFDSDGDTDLVVAEFGWKKTGRILLLRQQPSHASGTPVFTLEVLDERHGTIHVPVIDLNNDGRLDFVALISQEHETVVAFLNDGSGAFHRETIFDAKEPAFGSSGIELVDLDQDGDLDLLYTNGDTFDSFFLKPYHGIRWLENRGEYPFTVHELAMMPGVHRAVPGDLDGDGDLDIAACALLPAKLFGRQPPEEFDALLWLEQLSPGEFKRHSLERAACHHAALDVGDFDADGNLDIAVGGFRDDAAVPAVTIWWNQGRRVP